MKKTLLNLITFLLISSGLVLLAYPFVANYYTNMISAKSVSAYEQKVNSYDEAQLAKEVEKATIYDDNLIGQPLHDPFTPGAGHVLPDNYVNVLNVNNDGVMGSIVIPKIGVNLPIYHGVGEDSLQRGAGHIEYTSTPYGGIGRHSFISAHRGLPNALMFTDLNQLTQGDLFLIKVLGETHAYKVTEVLDVAWGAFGPLPASSATSKSSVSQPIGTSNAVYSALKSIDKKVEIKDTVSWESTISVGKLPSGESWSQDILLPSNGDVSNMRLVNSVNGTHIAIDPTTGRDTSGTFDGIGRSKFNGSYTLDSMKFSAFAPDTQVTFYNLLPSGAKVNPVTRTVNSDGTVDLTDLGNKKAMTITSGQNLSDLQSAGAKLTFTIKPQDNLKDDVYVAWMGNTTAPAGTVVSWPDDSTTVSSTVSGYVFEDANASHVKDKDESPFSGVSVQLQEKVGDNWTPVADYAGKSYSVKTNSDGYYEFVNLKSGTYRVVLPNVEREAGTNVVASINGATGVDAKDGDLPQAFTNRFDVTKPTVQTVSHRQYDKFSSSNPEVRVDKDSTLENVNFGYLLEKSDLTLDKSPATVTNSLYDSTVKWTVDITNTGKTPIDGAKLFDRTSKEVVGFQGSISYKKIENEITGTPIAASDYPEGYHTYSVEASTDGFWLLNYDGSLVKVQGITGTPLAVGRKSAVTTEG